MIRNPRQKEVLTKQEGGASDDKAPTSSRLWMTRKNPRIMCVSRSLGRKDRHSKVSTIRGLRDRRVRLSVPTAIQLYDLQEKLGLNQPSKVIDWLLNAAQHEIDKLPPLPLPLPLPTGNFIQFPPNVVISHEITSPRALRHEYIIADKAKPLFLSSNMGNSVVGDLTTLPKSTYWNSDVLMRTKQEAGKELSVQKGNKIIKVNGEENQAIGLMNNDMPYTSYCNWELSNAYTSHLESHAFQFEVAHNSHSDSRPYVLSSAPGSQLVMCAPLAMPSVFSPHVTASTNFATNHYNHFQMSSSALQIHKDSEDTHGSNTASSFI